MMDKFILKRAEKSLMLGIIKDLVLASTQNFSMILGLKMCDYNFYPGLCGFKS